MNPAWCTVTGWSSRALVSGSLRARCSLAMSRLPSKSSTKSYYKTRPRTDADNCYFNVGLIKPGSLEASKFKKLMFCYAEWSACSSVREELFKVVRQDTIRTGLCIQHTVEDNKCWFISDCYLELIDVEWRGVCVLIELIWLWGKCSKVTHKYINSHRCALT